MSCGCGNQADRRSFRVPSTGDRNAVAAAVQPLYEVLNARGQPTGRQFTSLTAAEQVAKAYGGSTRPL